MGSLNNKMICSCGSKRCNVDKTMIPVKDVKEFIKDLNKIPRFKIDSFDRSGDYKEGWIDCIIHFRSHLKILSGDKLI